MYGSIVIAQARSKKHHLGANMWVAKKIDWLGFVIKLRL
jgi:hypothetical protein